jgi:hypothetical protein
MLKAAAAQEMRKRTKKRLKSQRTFSPKLTKLPTLREKMRSLLL